MFLVRKSPMPREVYLGPYLEATGFKPPPSSDDPEKAWGMGPGDFTRLIEAVAGAEELTPGKIALWINVSNIPMPRKFRISSRLHDDLVDEYILPLTPPQIEEECRWFTQTFAEDIVLIRECSEAVEVRWGLLIAYW